ncbi:type VI secretion system protein TssA [Paragemmobacter straminiformis]|uniref:type VI secretion system protein TssA n=1 Tax=Paragemmobacter straminiformis TaxID=2045119 RepID=UPI0030CA4FBC
MSEFLLPREGASASGDNLEYDRDFIAMELAAQPDAERQMGDDVIGGSEPDWRDVAEKATAVLHRAHDLRAAAVLALAETKTRGVTGFAEATSYVRGCLEQWWDSCHPQLDADDDNDPTMRINALMAFADQDRMLKALRTAPLTDSRAFGRFSLRDILIAEGEISPLPSDTASDVATISAAFQDTSGETKEAIAAAIAKASSDVQAIDSIFSDRTPGQGPDLDQLSRMLYQLRRRVEDFTGVARAEPDAQDEEAAAPAGGGGPAAPAAMRGTGQVSSRQDVVAALDQIIAYYKRTEPSSPLAILIERAKGLVGADFLTIVKELAPEGLDSVQRVGGIKTDDY